MQGAELAYIHSTHVQYHTTQGDVSISAQNIENKMVKLGSKVHVHQMLKISQISCNYLVNVRDSVSSS